MSTSEKSFNQVRAILSKLDRSIDQAREKRLAPALPPPAITPPPPTAFQPAAKPAPAPAAPTSQYGRAQPLQRPQASALRWNP